MQAQSISRDITTSQNRLFLFVGFNNVLTMIKHIQYESLFTLHDVATSPNMILRSNIRLSVVLFFHFSHILHMKVCLHLVILWSPSRYEIRVKHNVLAL